MADNSRPGISATVSREVKDMALDYCKTHGLRKPLPHASLSDIDGWLYDTIDYAETVGGEGAEELLRKWYAD